MSQMIYKYLPVLAVLLLACSSPVPQDNVSGGLSVTWEDYEGCYLDAKTTFYEEARVLGDDTDSLVEAVISQRADAYCRLSLYDGGAK